VAERVTGLVAESRFFAPALVSEELAAVASDGLNRWFKGKGKIFIPNAELISAAVAIQTQFPGLRDPKAEHEEADAFVIALAQIRSGIVVTQETPAAEKNKPKRSHFIPDVCRELGISCISFLGMMRREGWKI
jgi:hypothetical protein